LDDVDVKIDLELQSNVTLLSFYWAEQWGKTPLSDGLSINYWYNC